MYTKSKLTHISSVILNKTETTWRLRHPVQPHNHTPHVSRPRKQLIDLLLECEERQIAHIEGATTRNIVQIFISVALESAVEILGRLNRTLVLHVNLMHCTATEYNVHKRSN